MVRVAISGIGHVNVHVLDEVPQSEGVAILDEPLRLLELHLVKDRWQHDLCPRAVNKSGGEDKWSERTGRPRRESISLEGARAEKDISIANRKRK